MSSPLSPSFRKPHTIPEGAAHPDVKEAIEDHDKNIVDLNQAIYALKPQITKIQEQVTTAASSTSASTAAAVAAARTEAESLIADLVMSGRVNNQTRNTTYTTQNSDNGALVLLNDSSPIGVELNNSVSQPWYCFIENNGSSVVTLTPQQGLINGDSHLSIAASLWATVFFDGSNYWAQTSASIAGVTQIVAGTNITISPPVGTGVVTVNASGGSTPTRYQVTLTGGTFAPGQGVTGTTAFTASPTSILAACLSDATSPAANEFLVAFAYSQNGAIAWSIFNVSIATVTLLSSTILNIVVL